MGNFLLSLKKAGRVKNIALILAFLLIAAVFLLVRKRQLIKRILSSMFRPSSQVALSPGPGSLNQALIAVGTAGGTLVASN